jgi:hypothetical protein
MVRKDYQKPVTKEDIQEAQVTTDKPLPIPPDDAEPVPIEEPPLHPKEQAPMIEEEEDQHKRLSNKS